MKKIFISFLLLFLIAGSFSIATSARAMTPVLSVSSTGSGDNVQINVSGDANASVLIFIGSQSAYLGTTNSSGTAIFTIGSSASENQSVFGGSGFSIPSNTTIYVKTNGLNGTQSNSVAWPYVTNSTGSTLTLSQSALLLNAGQTSTITASTNSLYILSNSNPSVANINLNANQITVTANIYGSTTANICALGSTTNCANITITVQNSGASQLSFSQNNFSIYSGQSVQVVVTGGSGAYNQPQSSNTNAAQASISGQIVTVTAGSTTGTASITVCTTDMNNCGIINVNSTTVNSTAITFSQSNPVVALGQSVAVTIFGGSGNNFYVSSNSNPSIVQANINSNVLTLIGNASAGTSTINVCAYAGSCASLTANVSNVSTGGAITLSQTALSILAGQSSNITISGGSIPYSISSQNSANVFSSVISGNILTIYGVNQGSASASVCSSTGCTSLSVTVGSTNSSANLPTFSQNNILLNVGQQSTVYVSGSGNYYVANNTGTNIASATISGSSVIVSAVSIGSDNISICQSGGQCATLYVTVSASTNTNIQLLLSQVNLSLTPGQSSTVYITGSGNYYISSNSLSGVASAAISGSTIVVSAISVGSDTISVCQSGGQCATLSVAVLSASNNPTTSAYSFSRYLFYGVSGDDVLKLQKILFDKKFLSATPNGHYGKATVAAVKKFQSANGINPLGAVGPSTRAILNQILNSSAPVVPANTTTSETGAQQISSIQQQIQQLLAQVAQMQK